MKKVVLSPLLKKQSLDFEIFSNLDLYAWSFCLRLWKCCSHRLCLIIICVIINFNLLTRKSKVVRQRFYEFKSVDNKQCVVLLLLDYRQLSGDTVDHEILLHRLGSKFALAWLQSYLTDPSQLVQIDGSTSSDHPLRFGVPQESVLGPLLYLLYTASLGDDLRRWHDMKFHLYADNTQTEKPPSVVMMT